MNILHLVRKQATKQQALHQAQVLLARQQPGAAGSIQPRPSRGFFLVLKLAQLPRRAWLRWGGRSRRSRCCARALRRIALGLFNRQKNHRQGQQRNGCTVEVVTHAHGVAMTSGSARSQLRRLCSQS